MGAGDRKTRKGLRAEKGLRTNPSGSVDEHFATAVVKSAQLEAEQFPNVAAGMLPASELAHVPSPHRRRVGVPTAPGVPVEVAGSLEASPAAGTGSYRDQLRANGQRALQRSWDHPTPPVGQSYQGAASPVVPGANEEQYMAMCCGLQQTSWSTPATGSSGFWPDAGLEMPQTPMSSMAVQDCQAAQMVPIQPFLAMPSNMANGPKDGLMAIAMPQMYGQCCDMNVEQIAAELRAALPVCYED